MDTSPTTTQPNGRGGLIVRKPNGQFAPGTQPPVAITSANARILAARRYDKQRAAFAAGVVQAIADTGLLPPGNDKDAAAWQVIANKATTVLLDADSARGVADLMQPIGRNAGWIAQDRERDDSTGGVRLEVWGDALDRVLDALRPRDVVDAQAIDVTTDEE